MGLEHRAIGLQVVLRSQPPHRRGPVKLLFSKGSAHEVPDWGNIWPHQLTQMRYLSQKEAQGVVWVTRWIPCWLPPWTLPTQLIPEPCPPSLVWVPALLILDPPQPQFLCSWLPPGPCFYLCLWLDSSTVMTTRNMFFKMAKCIHLGTMNVGYIKTTGILSFEAVILKKDFSWT